MVTENAEALVAQRATMAAVNFMLVYISRKVENIIEQATLDGLSNKQAIVWRLIASARIAATFAQRSKRRAEGKYVRQPTTQTSNITSCYPHLFTLRLNVTN